MDPKKAPIVSHNEDIGYASSTSLERTGEVDPKSMLSRTTTLGVSDYSNEKGFGTITNVTTDSSNYTQPAETAKDLVTEVIHVEDDPTLNPWTFRVWFLGMGLSTFGGSLATIYYFKPQTVAVSTIFLAVISYILGEALALCLPSRGWIGKLLNPHPFNRKEHAAIVVMATSAAHSPLAIEVLATQKLYYNSMPGPLICMLMILASQCLGYGIAGMLRKTIVYPTKMLFPSVLPLTTLIETLHGQKRAVAKKLKVFYIGFFALFVWEVMPQFVMPALTGISIFCLANRKNMTFTRIFGGANGNEGLGFLSLCLDFQYIGSDPMWLPLQTLINNFVGYLLCIVAFVAVYYGNGWKSQNFPFLSQLLFTGNSTHTHYQKFNQTLILNSHNEVDPSLIAAQGLPYFTGTFITYILSTNLAITATMVHLLLWNYEDIKSSWDFARWSNIKAAFNPRNWAFWKSSSAVAEEIDDPHYKLMLAYKDAPNWWYGLILVLSLIMGLISITISDSTLPWWGFLIACMLAAVCVMFFGAQFALTGFAFAVQPVIQMIGGYLHPGKPVANMMFVLFGYNSVRQGMGMLKDLKFGQYAKLPPRVTFTCQVVGTIIGAIFSYIMMDTITTNQRDILLSIEGTNVWSGQSVQQFNSQAIAWGGLAHELFSIGARYQWVTLAFFFGFLVPVPFYILHRIWPKLRFDYWNTAIMSYYIGFLFVGINSSLLSFFLIGFYFQFYLRKYRPNWFIKYNYILCAALDGGTQVIVFILTFAVQGGSGKTVDFPPYFGNNFNQGNYDFCMKDPATRHQ